MSLGREAGIRFDRLTGTFDLSSAHKQRWSRVAESPKASQASLNGILSSRM